MRYANIYIYIFVLHRDFFQQPHNDTGTCGCLTCTTGADGDNKTCDMDTD